MLLLLLARHLWIPAAPAADSGIRAVDSLVQNRECRPAPIVE
jgi:hypothetical protein